MKLYLVGLLFTLINFIWAIIEAKKLKEKMSAHQGEITVKGACYLVTNIKDIDATLLFIYRFTFWIAWQIILIRIFWDQNRGDDPRTRTNTSAYNDMADEELDSPL